MRCLLAVLVAVAVTAPAAQAGTISGTVRDSSNAPAGGVRVEAVRPSGAQVVTSTTTAANGTYTLAGIPAGSHAVRFASSHPTLMTEYHDGVPALSAAQLFDVTATSTETGIDALLATYPRLRGTVTGSDGPLSHLEVEAFSSVAGSVSRTHTDATGAYDFYVRDPFAETDTVLVHFHSPFDSLYIGQSHPGLELRPGSTTTLNAQLELGGGISGQLTDTNGSPFASGSAAVRKVGGGFAQTYQVFGSSYTARSLPPGNYTVLFSASDPPSSYQQYYDHKTVFQQPDHVTVRAGEITAGIDGTIVRLGSISGTVTDGTNPIRDVRVQIHRPDGSIATDAVTDASGDWAAGRLPAGSYRVRFVPDNEFAARWYDEKTTLAAADPVTVVGSGQTTGIDAAIGGGQVVGKATLPTGNPVAAGHVEVLDSAGVRVARYRVDPDGGYRISGLLPGTYTMRFTADEALPESRLVTIAAAETHTVDVEHSRGAIIQGGVRRDTGEPLNYVMVRVYRSNGTSAAAEFTNSNGRYQIAGLPAGSYKVFFDSPPQRQTESEYHHNKHTLGGADAITVGVPSRTTISAVLRSTGTISGAVRSDDGRALPGARVFLVREDGVRAGPFAPDATGNYAAHRLLPGRWKVYFKPPVSAYAGEYYSNKATLAAADWVTVTARSTTAGIDGSLSRAPAPALAAPFP